jgi:hypothetical protein
MQVTVCYFQFQENKSWTRINKLSTRNSHQKLSLNYHFEFFCHSLVIVLAILYGVTSYCYWRISLGWSNSFLYKLYISPCSLVCFTSILISCTSFLRLKFCPPNYLLVQFLFWSSMSSHPREPVIGAALALEGRVLIISHKGLHAMMLKVNSERKIIEMEGYIYTLLVALGKKIKRLFLYREVIIHGIYYLHFYTLSSTSM